MGKQTNRAAYRAGYRRAIRDIEAKSSTYKDSVAHVAVVLGVSDPKITTARTVACDFIERVIWRVKREFEERQP